MKIILYVIMFLSVLSNTVYADDFDINYSEVFRKHKMIRMVINVETEFIVQASQEAEDFYGYTREELLKMKISDINALTPEETNKELEAATEEKRNYFNLKHKLANGDVKDVAVYFHTFEQEGKVYLHSTVFDITHQIELSKSLEKNRKLTFYLISLVVILLLVVVTILYFIKEKYKELANHDYLTGAYSRLYLNEWKIRGKRTNNMNESSISIIMIDLKNFKHINDRYGHTVGDQVLKKVAVTLKDCIRENDVVVRYGGDEFLLILYNTSEEYAKIVMNRVENKLKANQEFDFPIEISYGIHETISGTDIFEVIKSADEEMYVMKNLNKN